MKVQKLLSLIRQSCERYEMIEEVDKIAVGVSGGKDSLTLLYGLKELHSLPWPWQTHHISQYIPAFRVQPGSHPCKPYLYCTSGNRVSYEFHLLNQHKILPLLPFSSLHFCMFYLKSISHIFREKTDFTEF